MAETVSFRGWRSGPGGDALDVQFYGATAEILKGASEDLKTALLQFPEVSAVEDNLAYDKEELILELTDLGDVGRDLEHRAPPPAHGRSSRGQRRVGRPPGVQRPRVDARRGAVGRTAFGLAGAVVRPGSAADRTSAGR